VTMRTRSAGILFCTMLGLWVGPRLADAQGPWTFTVSLNVSEVYTDNVFGTSSDRTSDFITQIKPGIGLTHQGPRLNFAGNYSVTGEIYADNSDLNNFGDNQNGSLSLSYRVDPKLTLTLSGYYAKTNDLALLLGQPAPVGVTVLPTSGTRRTETSTYTASLSADYQFDQQWSGTAAYTFAAVDPESGPLSTAHSGDLGVNYQLTQLDRLSATVTGSVFENDDTITSYGGTLGWTRQWSPQLSTTIGAGPEVTDGTVRGQANALVNYQATRELSAQLTYSYGTGLVVGQVGPSTVSALAGSLNYQPLRDLRLTAYGSWTWTSDLESSSAGDVNTYALSLVASYRLTDWLSASLSYDYTYDDGGDGPSVHENRVTVGLTASYSIPFSP
jgi:predicted porin